MLDFLNLILGGGLLIAGRKLFWLFVGAAGFITGIQLTSRFWHGNEGLTIIVGLAVGLAFALLAIFLQGVAIGIAGFLSGGYILSVLATMLGMNTNPVIYIIGGIIGLVLVSYLFDWAIITLSSLAGASLITELFAQQRGAGRLIFIILFIAGVVIQGSALRSKKGTSHQSD